MAMANGDVRVRLFCPNVDDSGAGVIVCGGRTAKRERERERERQRDRERGR